MVWSTVCLQSFPCGGSGVVLITIRLRCDVIIFCSSTKEIGWVRLCMQMQFMGYFGDKILKIIPYPSWIGIYLG